TAYMPASREAWIERQRAVDQSHHRADLLTEIREGDGGIDKRAGVPAGRLQCSAREFGGVSTVRRRIFAKAVEAQPRMAECRQCKCGRVCGSRPIARSRRCSASGICPGDKKAIALGAQIKIVSREVLCWAVGRSCDLRSVECRLDHAGDAV